jgi:hypothetical protein
VPQVQSSGATVKSDIMLELNFYKPIHPSSRHSRDPTNGDQGKGITWNFGFGDQETIEGMVTFRIDSRTIKRGIIWLNGLSSATRSHDSCICI